jgi:integrase
LVEHRTFNPLVERSNRSRPTIYLKGLQRCKPFLLPKIYLFRTLFVHLQEMYMATIQKSIGKRGVSYRVIIRKAGTKAISKTFPTKKLANQFILKLEADKQLLMAYGGIGSKLLFSELADNYIHNEFKGQRPKQQQNRLRFWVNIFGNKNILDVTRRDVSNGLNMLPSSYTNATINRYKALISVVFSYACREYDLPENPVRYIRALPEDNARVRFLSDDERSRLFEAIRRSNWDKFYLLVLLAITTGARKGELTSLRWNNIDFGRKTAYIATTKNGQPKVLPLTDDVIDELLKFNEDNNALIFKSQIRDNVSYCFTKPWRRALEQANIQDFRFHDLRHTTASYLAQSGASLLEIAEVLGHKQIQVTKRYAHLCIDHKQKLINKVMSNL